MPPQITQVVTALSKEYAEDMISIPQAQTPLGAIIEQHIMD